MTAASLHQRRRPCTRKCAAGRKCALDNDPQHPHAQHICTDSSCACHSAGAYGLMSVRRADGVRYVEIARLEVGE
jgi:hypothetical protein